MQFFFEKILVLNVSFSYTATYEGRLNRRGLLRTIVTSNISKQMVFKVFLEHGDVTSSKKVIFVG